MTDPDELRDPVLRAVAEYWADIRRYADAGQRDRLAALITDPDEEDADEVRAELDDLLLDVLPPDHPVIQQVRSAPMYVGVLFERSETELADELRRLGHLVLVTSGPAGPPPPSAPPAATAPAEAGSPDGDFDRQVQARLLALPALSADDLPGQQREADPGLVRLPRPDGGSQLPAFQFSPSGAAWPVVREINELLGAADDPWGVACWWADPHERLEAAPASVLGQDKDDLLRLAARIVGEDY